MKLSGSLLFLLCSFLFAQELTHPYFPLATGNKWEFVDKEGRKIKFKISHLDEEGNFRIMMLEKGLGSGKWISLKARYSDEFVQLHERDNAVVEEDTSESYLIDNLLPMSVKKGRIWEYRPGKAYDVRVGKIVNRESQTVPAGNFKDCVKIKLIKKDTILYCWFAKYVGWIRIRFVSKEDSRSSIDWRLNDYKVARHIIDKKYASPEEAFESYRQNLLAGTYRKAYLCLSELDREEINIREFAERMKNSPLPPKLAKAILQEVSIKGNTATATMILDGQKKPVVFIKENESWHLKNYTHSATDSNLENYQETAKITTQTFESPEEVFDNFRKNMILGDFREAYSCLSKRDQEKTSLKEFVNRMKKSSMPQKLKEAFIKELNERGDIATATMVIGENAVQIVFLKEDKSWRLKN